MKKVLLLSLALCLFLGTASAQTLSNVDFTKVYAAIEDQASPFYYPTLLERYLAHDSMLTVFDYHHLYYGYPKQAGYNPYARSAGEQEARKLLDAGQLDQAKQVLLSEFKRHPFNLGLIFVLGSIADQQQNTPEARQWMLKFDGLLRTIIQSGDGKSEESAWVVIAAQDEYPVMGVLGLEPKGQALLKGKYDRQTLQTPNRLESDELFFNIEIPYGHLAKAFSGNKSGEKKPNVGKERKPKTAAVH
ncbi:MAG: DUF4919 domain-containing protein [Rufibacter sp.]